MPPHPLTKFKIQKYYQNEPKCNGIYSRNNLPKTKDGVYVINLDEYKSIESHLTAFYVNGDNVIYIDNFEVEHISKEIKKSTGNKSITTNIYRIPAYNSVMCGYFCITFINFMLKRKILLDCNNFFPPNNYEKIDK